MASIIPEYNYDIFISYRQKDNKGDRWVSKFVEALKTELESTFKEDISVYFDINPHDGLLETHDVEESLKEKLKCLIFIPIISRTYCDPKSFAWEHEFKAFMEQASKDQFGLKVKLPNGNVASRVLPVRIYDLDKSDIEACESVLGGVMRGIEFIYSEPGVNRPLKTDDNENTNLNKTKYLNQINKVGNAIKETISGIKFGLSLAERGKISATGSIIDESLNTATLSIKKPSFTPKIRLLSTVIIVVSIIACLFAIYPRLSKHHSLDRLRSSGRKIAIAVLPFQNMTNDTSLNIWQRVIQDNLINTLSNTEDLKVRQTESVTGLLKGKGLVNYTSITPAVAKAVSRDLEADIYILGSLKISGNTLRINTQLIDSKSNDVFKSFQLEGPPVKFLYLADSLSWMVKNFLIISKLEAEQPKDFQLISRTNSVEAYKSYIYGQQAFLSNDFSTALKMFSQSISFDSNYFDAAIMLPFAYRNLGLVRQAKVLCINIYNKRDQMNLKQSMYVNWLYATFFETPHETIKYAKQILELDDQSPSMLFVLAGNYSRLNQYDNAIAEVEKAFDIFKKWGSKPSTVWLYTFLGSLYHKTGEYKKEAKLYKQAEIDFPDNPELFYQQAVLSLALGDNIQARHYIDRYTSLRSENGEAEKNIIADLASIYSDAGIQTKAENYYRQALSLDPDDIPIMTSFAYFLIDSGRNINEGLNLINKALKTDPGNYLLNATKGYGLYKQGKFRDALVFLQKSDSLKPFYNHDIYLHLEAAKKAVAEMHSDLR